MPDVAPDQRSHVVSDAVELVLPADARHVRLARLVASGLATTQGFDVDDVADFRIAVDELCATLLEMTRKGVALRFQPIDNGTVVVDGRTTGPADGPPDPMRLSLASQILDAVTDTHEFRVVDGHAECSLVSRLPLRARHRSN